MKPQSSPPQVRLRLAYISEPSLAPIDSEMQKIIVLLHQELSKHHRIPDLAKKLEISPRQFERRFKDATDYSYRHYMKKIRLEKASELLATTKWGIKKISAEVGLNAVSHFSACFRKKYKQTPAEYRKRMYGKWRDVAFAI